MADETRLGNDTLRAAVVGAAGYAGIELVRLLAAHPRFQVTRVTSAKDAGRAVSDLYPALAGVDLVFVEPNVDDIVASADVAFLAVPHTAAMAIAPALLDAGLTVIDASADFRLKDAELYRAWYGVEHVAPKLLPHAVYGLPELHRAQLPGATLVACPGCYPTASLLASVPVIEAGLTKGARVIVDAKSGVSGAGRTPTEGTHFVAVDEAVAPYKVTQHRHTPEIAQELALIVGSDVSLVFTPHLVPMNRGLLATVYLDAADGVSAEDVHAAYRARYDSEPFITLHSLGRMPSTGEVRGSNRAHLGVALDERAGVIIAACAIDNLVKGTSGQAVQCANLALGFDETLGLMTPVPVV